MLYRFREIQAIELGLKKPEERRPYNSNIVNSLPKAERWRRQVIKDISRAVSRIHDGSLPENEIRDLNDQINKLLREKGHWENRIKEIGGPDYKKIGPKLLDEEGKELPGNKGYKYFGRARDLPGVRELLSNQTAKEKKQTKADLYKNINAQYYGYNDEDADGELLDYEERVSKKQLEWLSKSGKPNLGDFDSSDSDTSSEEEI
ncbi:hypothetical protein BB560_003162 [Smittium megazygosporum]|uniref:Pre-mRNA-splicing factor ISY1 n=1 Tax=Smittium megazygosporum TaxID=133381 RepID=A0A2T9ZCW1_9FUNG|nr:hypothetical protein BB560_003162 [Smittium megazygosporum]